MRISTALLVMVLASVLLMSCMSTRVYQKETALMYEGGSLLEETSSFLRDEKQVKTIGVAYYTTTMEDMLVLSRTESSSKADYQTLLIQLFQGDTLYAEKEYRIRNGARVANSGTSSGRAGKSVSSAFSKSALLDRACEQVLAERAAMSDSDADGAQLRVLTTVEQIQVESTPNSSYIFYSVLGKPLVIVGTSSWNLLKCVGYAFINFMGGYNTVVNGNFFWKMPDVKKSREKAVIARASNAITTYPEYHLPFTNNHISVTATTSETTNAFSDSAKQVKVLAEENYEYDNTLSVERTASADANATAATIGMVGTVVTVPVSAITWIGGAAFGIYAETQTRK